MSFSIPVPSLGTTVGLVILVVVIIVFIVLRFIPGE